jgi:multidrug efflux pump subunit AcrA (membrane-fusion protein)
VDVATGGLAIKIGFADPVDAPVGLTVATNIIVDQRDAALTVPRTALRPDGSATGVFVVEDGVARLQPVTLVEWPAARLIVTSGLSEGDARDRRRDGIAEGQAVVVDQALMLYALASRWACSSSSSCRR